jgi:hypothetical protein
VKEFGWRLVFLAKVTRVRRAVDITEIEREREREREKIQGCSRMHY